MKGRNKLFFNLLTFLLLVVIVLVGLKTREADKQIKSWEAEIKRRQERGVQDPVLRATVDKLEADLQARLKETFNLEEDPLDLTRVIHTRKFFRKLFGEMPETETRMRLSCTVTSEEGQSAIIKYRGRSNVLMVGDEVRHSTYRVVSIGKSEVVLRRGNERLILKTEKAPDTIAEEEKRRDLGMKDPVIEVNELPIGNY
ncbi:hypothetical protein HQ587_00220 [bacterium]|nr:hypothetical protein [bacterium]